MIAEHPSVLKLWYPAEVAEAVGDQAAAVDLHPAQHVRPGAEDQVGAGADRHVGELDRVAAVLAQVGLLGVGRVGRVGALGAGVDRDDDEVGASRRAALISARAESRSVSEVVFGVGGEAEEGDAHARRPATTVASAGQPGRRDAGRPQRLDRFPLAGLAEVEGVVVGQVTSP